MTQYRAGLKTLSFKIYGKNHSLIIKKRFVSRNEQVTLTAETSINIGNPHLKPVF